VLHLQLLFFFFLAYPSVDGFFVAAAATSPSSPSSAQLQLSMATLAQQIAEVQEEIKEVKQEIKQTNINLESCNPDDKPWFRKQIEQLRDKENRLRDKENRLRDQLTELSKKENLLLQQQQQQVSTAAASSASQGGRTSTPPRQRVPAFQAFWRCLCNLAVAAVPIPGVVDGDSEAAPYWLQLRPSDSSRPVHWLGELVLGDYLYVRSCYRRLYTMLKSIWNEKRWVLLLGSPGIGKSMFRCYILYQLCQEHIPRKESFSVLLQYPAEVHAQPNGACELLRFKAGLSPADAVACPDPEVSANAITCERSPSATLPTAWSDLLISPPEGEHIYYITDGMSPFASSVDPSKVHILEVSSPQQSRWKAFKEGLVAAYVKERYMPLVSLAEMLQLHEHVGQLSAAEVVARYKQLGGSIRSVIVRAGELPEQIINKALAHAGSLDAVISSSTMSGELEGAGLAHIPSTLVHFRVIEEEEAGGPLVNEAGDVIPSVASPPIAAPFTRYEAVFASNYVRSKIRHKFHSRFMALLGEMVRTADLPYTSVLQGNLYEEFVHERVQHATPNPCPMRSLEPASGAVSSAASVRIIDLSSRPCVEFDDTEDLSALELKASHYYKPISKSFGAVDFVLGLDTVGNMTLNLRQGISITALLRVVHAMGFQPVKEGESAPVLRFFWLLPSRNLFKRIKKQPLSYGGRVIPPLDSSSAAASSSYPSSSQTAPTLTTGQRKLMELEKLVQLHQFAVYMPPQQEDEKEEAAAAEAEQANGEEACGMDIGDEGAEQLLATPPDVDSSNEPRTKRARKRKASDGQCESGNVGETKTNHNISSGSSHRR